MVCFLELGIRKYTVLERILELWEGSNIKGC